MKKLFLLAAGALVLASCSNEEMVKSPRDAQGIAFNAVVKSSSRGAVNAKSTWGADLFVASAYQAEVDGTYLNLFGANPYVKYTYGGANWTSSPVYFYPDHGTLDFFAYATGTLGEDQVLPANTTFSRNTTEGSDKSFTGLVLDYSGTGHELAGKTDVMYAFKAGVTCPYSDKVQLQMQHTLAWLTVSISEALDKLKVVSVTIDDVYLTGSVSIPVTDHVVGAPTWTVKTADKKTHVNFDAFCPATPTLVKDLTDVAEGLLIVPGVMTTGKQTTLTFKYEMTDNPGVVFTKVINLGAGADGYNLPDWQAGKHYEYNIIVGLQAIEFKCLITDFGTSTDVPDSVNL